ncbi:MAG: GTPase Era [Deltaproteobacteria bacterium]|nr:GTPase Era [Deltaproteobacteria bacterium]
MQTGFVAIIGAPNVGKSTFLNQVLEFKLAITSDKPQTTRHRLLGIYNDPERQIVFLDTPGLHTAKRALNQRMVDTALAALEDVDAALFMVEASRRGLDEGRRVAPVLAKAGLPVVAALNKIDLVADKARLLPLLAEVASWGEWRALVPLSAQTGDGAALVIEELGRLLPAGEPLFPPDEVTDLSMRFLVGELIREKVFRLTRQELPYATAVTVDEFLEPAEPGRPVAVTATIHVERDSQKGMIIGKGGSMIKRIGSEARLDMQELLGLPVFLDLFVRVEPNWSQTPRGLDKLGY